MKIGLYFGTFNPIHVGHLIIANHMVSFTELDQVWLVVSPQNPLKKKESLLADYHRLELVNRAIYDNDALRASDIEFKLEKPSYTGITLAYIQEKFPMHQFSLIMGEDNLRTFHRWRNYASILDNHQLFVYPRILTEQELSEGSQLSSAQPEIAEHKNVKLTDAPIMKVSASFIRRSIKEGRDTRYLLTEPVFQYIDEMNFYK